MSVWHLVGRQVEGDRTILDIRTSEHPFRLAWAGVDAAVWVLALVLATVLRYEAFYDQADWRALALVAMLAIILQLVTGFVIGPYGIGHTRGSYEEILDLIKTVVIVATIVTIVNIAFHPHLLARSVPMIAFPFALVGMLGLRLIVREWKAATVMRTDQSGSMRPVASSSSAPAREVGSSAGPSAATGSAVSSPWPCSTMTHSRPASRSKAPGCAAGGRTWNE